MQMHALGARCTRSVDACTRDVLRSDALKRKPQ
jgi:hypothetical protein